MSVHTAALSSPAKGAARGCSPETVTWPMPSTPSLSGWLALGLLTRRSACATPSTSPDRCRCSQTSEAA
ncbi:MAG: hypothetical protein M5R40_20500 [Anaerolineae bacterium]|nr:hypothetical protein [Anaerolineae bacterium]